MRNTDSLFVIVVGPCKVETASHSTISQWFRPIILQAYGLKTRSHLFQARHILLGVRVVFLQLQDCCLIY